MSENNRPDSEQKNGQASAEDILAQVDNLLADLENTTAAQFPAVTSPPETEKQPETEPPGEPEPPAEAQTEEAAPSAEQEAPAEADTPDADADSAETAEQPAAEPPTDEKTEPDEQQQAPEAPADAETEPDESKQKAEARSEESQTEAPPGEQPAEAPAKPAEEAADSEPQPAEKESAPDTGKPKDKSKSEKGAKPKSTKTKFKKAPKSPEVTDDADDEFPSLKEISLLPPQNEETAGMTFVQKAQYHAKMRRREQTRLRRENARRIQEGGEVTYQPMTPFDMRDTLVRLGIAAVLLAIGFFLNQSQAGMILYLLAYLLTVFPTAVHVANNVTHGKLFDEYLLIFLASLGAFLLKNHAEASIVLILFDIGKIAADIVLASTHNVLTHPTDFLPEKASVVNMKGEEKRIAPSEIRLGEFVLVRSGERVPIDGMVLRGEGTMDDSVLTGEKEPVKIGKNSRVLAGSLYTGSLLLIRAVARFDDCAVNQITRVQDEAREHKAALESNVVHTASRIMPILLVVAVLVAAVPPLFLSGTSVQTWIYRALTILVACSPVALTVSVPLAFLCGSGRLEHKGIHMKGSEAIEKAAELRMVVFNKTGTLTTGELQVKQIYTAQNFKEEEILALAASAEQLSQHPVARAIVTAYPNKPPKVVEFEEFPGRGVRARIGDRNVLVGNHKLMVSRGVRGLQEIVGTVAYVAFEGDYAGAIVLEDTVRPSAAEAVKELKNQGVQRTVLLTGDTEVPTRQAAAAVGIDAVHCGLMPEEKAAKMDFLLRTIPTDGTAAYVGDGVCDIEEIKMADIGVAMGMRGSHFSADAANMLITTNDLTLISDAVRLCRRTHSIVMQNVLLLLIVKALLAVLSLFGLCYMWLAVAVDVVLTVLAVLNAARMLNAK